MLVKLVACVFCALIAWRFNSGLAPAPPERSESLEIIGEVLGCRPDHSDLTTALRLTAEVRLSHQRGADWSSPDELRAWLTSASTAA